MFDLTFAQRLTTAALALALLGCGPETAQSLTDKATAALKDGDPRTASVYLKNALQKEPRSAQARLLLGSLLLDAGDAKGAEIELRKAQEYGQPLQDVAPLLAQAVLSQGQYARLISDFGSLAVQDPAGQADLAALIATAHLFSGQAAKARELAAAAAARWPQSPAVSVTQARLLATQGDIDGALRLLDATSASGRRQADLWRLQADLLLFGKGDRAAAEAAYTKLLNLPAHSLYARSKLVSLALTSKNLPRAKELLEPLARSNPNHPLTRFLEAHVALANDEVAKAREIVTPLLSSLKGDSAVLMLAGTVELRLGAPIRAEKHLRQALSAAPESPEPRRLLAMTYVQKGEPAAALEMLAPLLQSERVGAQDLSLAGEAHLLSGNLKQAEEYFARAVRAEPGNLRAKTTHAVVLIAAGKVEPGVADLRSIAAADTGTTADMALASAHLRRGDFDAALAAIDGFDKKAPRSPVAADLRGRVLLLKHDSAGARAAFETALARDAAYFSAAASLAKMDLADGKPDSAQERYENVLKADPRNTGALVALAGLKAQRRATPADVTALLDRAIAVNPSNASTHAVLIEYWLTKRSPKRALEAAQAALAAVPDDGMLLGQLGRAQLLNSQTSQAIATFGKLAAQQPKSAGAQMSLADAYMAAGNHASAEHALQQALTLNPNQVVAQRKLIAMAVNARQPAKALRIARDVQKQPAAASAGHLLEGDIHAAMKDWDAAAKSYRAALQGPGAGLGAARLHMVLNETKGRPAADAFASDWLKRNEKDTVLRWHLARTAANARNYREAEQWYASIVALEPDNVAAINDLAWVMIRNANPQAAAMAERAAKLAPENPTVLDTLADALAHKGDHARAIDVAKSAVVLAPETPLMRLNLAKIHLRAKDTKSARAELEQVVKLGSNSRESREAAELMKTLR